MVRYLHGRVTQNIKALAAGDAAESLVLTPQGRIQGHFRVLRRATDVLILSDPLPTAEDEAALQQALLQFKVADDVQFEPCSDAWRLIRLFGATDLGPLGFPSPNAGKFVEAEFAGSPLVIIGAQWGAAPVIEFLTPPAVADQLLARVTSELSACSLSAEEEEVLRIAAKRPLMGRDLNEDVLGPEIDVTDCVSFNKGCYAGQEVVEMATARGRPNRRLALLTAESAEPLPHGAPVVLTVPAEQEKKAGIITSSIKIPQSSTVLALAFLRSSCPEDASLAAAGVAVRVVQ